MDEADFSKALELSEEKFIQFVHDLHARRYEGIKAKAALQRLQRRLGQMGINADSLMRPPITEVVEVEHRPGLGSPEPAVLYRAKGADYDRR
jgi:hypothetical protein